MDSHNEILKEAQNEKNKLDYELKDIKKKKDVVEIDSDIVLNSKLGIETKVKLGEVIGKRK